MKESEVTNYVASHLPNWSIKEGKLFLEIKTKNWSKSMSIANMISFLAEELDHHPDLTIKYSTVIVQIFTHSSNSITDKDFALAQKINLILNINN